MTFHPDVNVLIIASIIYLIWTQLSYFSLPKSRKPTSLDSSSSRHRKKPSLRIDSRESRKKYSHPVHPGQVDDFGYVWMTVPKNYRLALTSCLWVLHYLNVCRGSLDDGVLTGLLLGPLITCACLYTSLKSPPRKGWLIEDAPTLNRSDNFYSAPEALVLSRRQLLQQTTLCSFILLMHLVVSRKAEARYRARYSAPEGERGSVPRNELHRNCLYAVLAIGVSTMSLILRYIFEYTSIPIWQG